MKHKFSKEVIDTAKKELHEEIKEEKFRAEVEKCKAKLREKKPLFPWRIKIIRID